MKNLTSLTRVPVSRGQAALPLVTWDVLDRFRAPCAWREVTRAVAARHHWDMTRQEPSDDPATPDAILVISRQEWGIVTPASGVDYGALLLRRSASEVGGYWNDHHPVDYDPTPAIHHNYYVPVAVATEEIER